MTVPTFPNMHAQMMDTGTFLDALGSGSNLNERY